MEQRIEELQTRKTSENDTILMAQGLPDSYLEIKNQTIANCQNVIESLDRRIQIITNIIKENNAKISEPDYDALKIYGENLNITLLREIQAIVDDTNLTDDQKRFLILSKGGLSPV